MQGEKRKMGKIRFAIVGIKGMGYFQFLAFSF